MRKIQKLLILALVGVFLIGCSKSKDVKSGKVKFKMSYELNPENANKKMAPPQDFEIMFKEGLVRMPTVNDDYLIKDYTRQKEIEKKDFNGEALFIDHGSTAKGTFTEGDGSKTIAGYKCEKGEVKIGNYAFEVYYTKDLSADFSPIGEIDGFVLEFAQAIPEGKVRFTAQGVQEIELVADLFTIPENAKLVTAQEFTAMMQKGGASGSPAPQYSKLALDGSIVSLAKNKGNKVTVLNFWATWCGPCKVEIPDLNLLVEKYKGKNVEFIGFADDDAGKVSQFLLEKPFNYTIVAPAKDVAAAYGISGYPTNIVIDKDGKIVESKIGYDPTIVDILSTAIDKSL